MTPRAGASDAQLKGKAAIRAALNKLSELNGKQAARTVGVGYQLLHAWGSLNRANVPPSFALDSLADYCNWAAGELSKQARLLRRQADRIAREENASDG